MATLTLTPKGFRASLPSGLPDLIVQSVSVSPSSPNVGDHVVFSAVVKNQGTGPTPSDIGIGVLFSIDSAPVNWTTDTQGALAGGSTRTLTATDGTSGAAYWVATEGDHSLLVNVNDTLTISETVTVNNKLTSNVSVAAVTAPPPTGGVIYGPVGDEQPLIPTPSMDDPITVTIALNDYAGLNAAIAAHATSPGPIVIGLASGNWTAGTAGQINDVTGLSSRTQNILIRPVTIGGVHNSSQWRVAASSITIAHMVGGGWYATSPKNFCAWNNVIAAGVQSTVNVGDTYEIVGCVKPNKGTTDSDCNQVHSKNGLIRRNWFEGRNRLTNGHCDNMQVLGHSGYLKIQNEYHGGGGTGQQSTFFFKEDAQAGAPQPQIQITDSFFGSANNDLYIELDGNGQTINLTRVVSQDSIILRLRSGSQAWSDSYVPTTTTDCKAASYVYADSTGKLIQSNPTPGVTLTPGIVAPVFSPPTWWNHDWDTL